MHKQLRVRSIESGPTKGMPVCKEAESESELQGADPRRVRLCRAQQGKGGSDGWRGTVTIEKYSFQNRVEEPEKASQQKQLVGSGTPTGRPNLIVAQPVHGALRAV
eukprot:352476-Chlamydomonas_euryale.AAC.5